MADNYLEKRMADYRAGRAAGPVRIAGRRPGTAVIKYAPRTILLYRLESDFATAIIDVFAAASCKIVVVAAADPAPGHGARFYAVAESAGVESVLNDVAARDESVDVVIAQSIEPWMLGRKVVLLNSTASQLLDSANCEEAMGSEVAEKIIRLQGSDTRQAALLCLAFAAVDASIQGQIVHF